MKHLRDTEGNTLLFLPALLQSLREKTGLSMTALAGKLKLTPQQYYQMENGVTYPLNEATGVYKRLAKIFDVDEETLLAAAENERIRRRLYKDFQGAFRLLDKLAIGYIERKKEGYTAVTLLDYAIKNAPHK